MKRKSIYLILIIALSFSGLTSCKSKKENKGMKIVTVTEQTIQSDFSAKPDESINFNKVKEHYAKFPERWDAVFKFLQETDLKTIESGRVDLNEDVYAAVSEYETKNPEDALFESHKKYIDLQYVISGEELIGLTNDHSIEVSQPYSEEKDIMFYNFDGGKLLEATPNKYFIFFPEDIHRPSIKTNENSMVKKVVMKIKVD